MSQNTNMSGLGTNEPRHYPMADYTLVTQEEIWAKTKQLAKRIAEDYKPYKLSLKNPLILVCVLKGSYMFTADLARFLTDAGVPVILEFLCASSYGSGVTTSGEVRLLLDVRDPVENRHVLIVEDIVDSAITLRYLLNLFKTKKPATLKTVVLLDKPSGRKTPLDVDYSVVTIPKAFVIGYGMDYDEAYRELRDVVVLKKSIYEHPSNL